MRRMRCNKIASNLGGTSAFPSEGKVLRNAVTKRMRWSKITSNLCGRTMFVPTVCKANTYYLFTLHSSLFTVYNPSVSLRLTAPDGSPSPLSLRDISPHCGESPFTQGSRKCAVPYVAYSHKGAVNARPYGHAKNNSAFRTRTPNFVLRFLHKTKSQLPLRELLLVGFI